MRITVISSHFPPAAGGVADYTQAWCEAMRGLGHEITVITSSPNASCEGLEVNQFGGLWSLRGYPGLSHMVLASRPDVIVVQYVPHAYSPRGGGLPVATLLWNLARSTQVPMVLHAHEIYGAWSESLKRVPFHITQRLAAAVFASCSSAIVVTVKSRQRRLEQLLWPWHGKIHAIQIGPTVQAHEPDPLWRERHGVSPDTFLMTSFGLGHPTQEVGQLPLVLDALTAAGIDARLFLAGRLNVEHPLVTHLGYLSAQDASQMLAAGDVFALPLADGVSGRRSSAISALAAGATVVTTTGRDTDHSLFDAEGLVMTPAGDDQAFCAAVIDLAMRPEIRKQIGTRGQRMFAENFSWSVIAVRWEQLLSDCTR